MCVCVFFFRKLVKRKAEDLDESEHYDEIMTELKEENATTDQTPRSHFFPSSSSRLSYSKQFRLSRFSQLK